MVTVIGAEAPHSVIYSPDADDPLDAEKCLFQIAQGLANLATNNAILTGGSAIVVLNPEHADALARANMDRATIAQRLWELTHVSSEARITYGQQFTAWQKDKDVGASYPAFPGPENILVLVAGGVGLYTTVMPTWSAGAHNNAPVSVKVDYEQFCEI